MSQTNQNTMLIPSSATGPLMVAGFALPAEITPELPSPLLNDYGWFDKTNEREFLTFCEGLMISGQQGLPHQVQHYKERITTVVTKDLAERLGLLIHRQFGQATGKEWSQPFLGNPATHNRGIVRLFQRNWQIHPVRAFAQYIPLHALRVLSFLDTLDYQPNGRWVAEEYVAPRSTPPRFPDPLLVVNYGGWIVSVAQWK